MELRLRDCIRAKEGGGERARERERERKVKSKVVVTDTIILGGGGGDYLSEYSHGSPTRPSIRTDNNLNYV